MSRKHGLSWPLHPLQIFLWFLLIGQITMNDLSVLPVLPENVKAVYSLIYHVSFMLILYFGAKTTLADPTDVTSRLQIVVQNKASSGYCPPCKSTVNKNSKHCTQCGRCVYFFDHHCRWVNNCIGRKNYKSFIFCLLSFLTNSITIFVVSVIVLIEFFLKGNLFQGNRWRRYEEYQDREGWVSEIVCLIVYSSATSLWMVYLTLFHARLKVLGLTTFEYILMKRKTKATVSNNTNETISKDAEVSVTVNHIQE